MALRRTPRVNQPNREAVGERCRKMSISGGEHSEIKRHMEHHLGGLLAKADDQDKDDGDHREEKE
eukprot:scaffold28648_cov154-Skeletonema_menzelii.AAC.6